ncbi:MAG: hypothetical protein Q8L52_01275 [bacterium]|nr:hypothetical protein [bacterium]
MNIDTDRNKIIIGSVITVVVILGAIGVYYYTKKPTPPATSDLQTAATQGVLPSIGEASNPLTNKPDINPTSKTNPFDSVKTNPFQ